MGLLRYIFGNISDFESLGIDVTDWRKSLDGLQTFSHQENLNDAQIQSILTAWKDGASFNIMSNENPEFNNYIATNYGAGDS